MRRRYAAQALIWLTNGNGSSNIMIVWDHGRTPGCANSKIAAPRGPWQNAPGTPQPYVDNTDVTHYPVHRHDGVFNVLFCDAHVTSMTQNDLADALQGTADELSGEGSSTFRLVVEGTARDLDRIFRAEVKDNLRPC